MTVKEIKKDTEHKMKKGIESVQREFSEVRTGRAHPGLIEGMHVNCYGGDAMLLKQVASISVPDELFDNIQAFDIQVSKCIFISKFFILYILCVSEF